MFNAIKLNMTVRALIATYSPARKQTPDEQSVDQADR
jgi:hypothetical protein